MVAEATATRLALSDRYFDLVGLVVEGVGLRYMGLRASAASSSMSSGVKGLRIQKSLMLRAQSGLRYEVLLRVGRGPWGVGGRGLSGRGIQGGGAWGVFG